MFYKTWDQREPCRRSVACWGIHTKGSNLLISVKMNNQVCCYTNIFCWHFKYRAFYSPCLGVFTPCIWTLFFFPIIFFLIFQNCNKRENLVQGLILPPSPYPSPLFFIQSLSRHLHSWLSLGINCAYTDVNRKWCWGRKLVVPQNWQIS